MRQPAAIALLALVACAPAPAQEASGVPRLARGRIAAVLAVEDDALADEVSGTGDSMGARWAPCSGAPASPPT
jgi:hypothetical protein